MAGLLFVATESGLTIARRIGDDWIETGRGLDGQQVTGVIAREGVVLAGTHEGVWRSDDLGRTWQMASDGLELRHVRWLAYHPDISDREFAGTEPAGIFVSHDGAATWRACPEVAALRDRFAWSLPYSPAAGCVRGFAYHGSRAYAAVEVGGVLRSDDGGETWRLAGGSSGRPDMDIPPAPLVHADVHSIAVHPVSPDLVYAATGEGFYRSQDGGQTWECLYRCYCRAAWLDPADPGHVLLGPADRVERAGRIEASYDGGQSWQPASTGLAVPWPRHMVERFVEIGGDLVAVLSNGEAWRTALSSLAWQRLLPAVQNVTAAAWLDTAES